MKTVPFSAPLFAAALAAGLLFPLSPPCSADEGSGPAAEVTDASGTVTRVEGLHYCYEEEEDGALYRSRFDCFFVRKGDAVIEASFRNLQAVTFTGPARAAGTDTVRPARVRLSSGKEVEVQVRVHPGSFLAGRLELGEFRLDMDKVKRVVFPAGGGPSEPGFRVILFPRAEAPGGAAVVTFPADGTLRLEGPGKTASDRELKEGIARSRGRVFVKAEARVPYAVFRKQLERLRRAGARTVLLGP